VLFFTRTYPPLDAAYDFTDDIRDRDYDAAFAQVCDRLRRASSRAEFDAFARRLGRAESTSVDLLSVDRDGDSANVEIDATYPGDETHTITLRLVHEDDDWRPCGASSD